MCKPTLALPMPNWAIVVVLLLITVEFLGQVNCSDSAFCSGSEAPVVTVTGGQLQRLYTRDPVNIVAGISSVCSGLAYQWDLQDSKSGSTLDLNSTSDAPDTFFLPPYSLLPGANYSLTVHVSDANGNDSAQVRLAVLTSDLEISIPGGSSRSLSYYDDIEIEAQASDPDREDGSLQGAHWSWGCVRIDSEQACNATMLQQSNASLLVNAEVLYPNATYMFYVNVSGTSRTSLVKQASTSVLLYIDPRNIPYAYIENSGAYSKVNPGQRVVLKGRCRARLGADRGVAAAWSAARTGGGGGGGALDLVAAGAAAGLAASVPAQTTAVLRLIIPSLDLNSATAETLTFTLSAHYEGQSALGYAQVDVALNAAPRNGTLLAAPPNGTALRTRSNLTAAGWADAEGDLPLRYAFLYLGAAGQEKVVRALSPEAAALGTYLPLGTSGDGNYTLVCRVSVQDALGASGAQDATVVSLPPSASLDEISVQMADLLSDDPTSDTAGYQLQVVSAVASVVDGQCSNMFESSQYTSSGCAGIVDTLVDTIGGSLDVIDVSLENMDQVASAIESVAGSAVVASSQQKSLLQELAEWSDISSSIGILASSPAAAAAAAGRALGAGVATPAGSQALLGAARGLGAALGLGLGAGEGASTVESENLNLLAQKLLPEESSSEIQLSSSSSKSAVLSLGDITETSILVADFGMSPFGESSNLSVHDISSYVGLSVSSSSSSSSRKLTSASSSGYIQFSILFSHPRLYEAEYLNDTLLVCEDTANLVEEASCGPEAWQVFPINCNGTALVLDCNKVKNIGTACKAVDTDGSLVESCERTFFNASHTVCTCLQKDDDAVFEVFFLQMSNIGSEVLSNFEATSLLFNVEALRQNWLVFVTLGVTLFLVPFLTYSPELGKLLSKGSKCKCSFRSIMPSIAAVTDRILRKGQDHSKEEFSGFEKVYQNVIPNAMRKGNVGRGIWALVVKEHLGLRMFRSPRWPWTRARQAAYSLAVFLTMMMWDATVFGAVFPASGACSGHASQAHCEVERNPYDTAQSVCTWDGEAEACSEAQPEETAVLVLYITIVTMILSMPIEILLVQVFETLIFPDQEEESGDEYAGFFHISDVTDDSTIPVASLVAKATVPGKGHDIENGGKLESLQLVSSENNVDGLPWKNSVTIQDSPPTTVPTKRLSVKQKPKGFDVSSSASQAREISTSSLRQPSTSLRPKDFDVPVSGSRSQQLSLTSEPSSSQSSPAARPAGGTSSPLLPGQTEISSIVGSSPSPFNTVKKRKGCRAPMKSGMTSSTASKKAAQPAGGTSSPLLPGQTEGSSSVVGSRPGPFNTLKRKGCRAPMKSGMTSKKGAEQDDEVIRITGGGEESGFFDTIGMQDCTCSVSGIQFRLRGIGDANITKRRLSIGRQNKASSKRRSSVFKSADEDSKEQEDFIRMQVDRTFQVFVENEGYRAIRGTFSRFDPMYYTSQNRQVIHLKRKIRAHYLRTCDLLTEMAAATGLEKKEALLMRAARRDYQTLTERRVLGLVEQAEGGGGGRAYRGAGAWWLRLVGWTIIILYCAFCCFYVSLFGLNHGPLIATLWLQTFFIGVFEDFTLLLPLKFWVIFYLLPAFMSRRIELSRLEALPSYSSSRTAAKAYPGLTTSKIILRASLEGQDPSLLKVFKGGAKRGIVLFSVLLFGFSILPFFLQELILEACLAAVLNCILLGMVVGHQKRPEVLYPVVILAFGTAVLYKAWHQHHRKKKKHREEIDQSHVSVFDSLPASQVELPSSLQQECKEGEDVQ